MTFAAAEKENVRSARQFRLIPTTVPTNEWPSYNVRDPYGPGTYAYGFEVNDPHSNNIQFRDEERLPDGTVRGRYGLVLPNGEAAVTQYIADEHGYRTAIDRIRAGPFNQRPQAQYPVIVLPPPGQGGVSSTPAPPTVSSTPENVPIFADVQQYPQRPTGPIAGFFQNVQNFRPTGPFGQIYNGFTDWLGSQNNQGQRPGFFPNLLSNFPWLNNNNQNVPVPLEDYNDFNQIQPEITNNGLSPYSPLYVTNPNTKESGWFKRFIERRRWNQLLRRADIVAITPGPTVLVNKK